MHFIPICAVIGILILAIIAWLMVSGLKIRDLAKAPAIACGRCGHMLADGQMRCPECATVWTDEWLARLKLARLRSWKIRVGIAIALLALVLALTSAAFYDAIRAQSLSGVN